MMKLAALALLALPALAQAQSTCRAYEFAELKDMRRSELELTYCQYNIRLKTWLDLSLLEARAGRSRASDDAMKNAQQCNEETARIGRVLAEKHKIGKAQCQ